MFLDESYVLSYTACDISRIYSLPVFLRASKHLQTYVAGHLVRLKERYSFALLPWLYLSSWFKGANNKFEALKEVLFKKESIERTNQFYNNELIQLKQLNSGVAKYFLG